MTQQQLLVLTLLIAGILLFCAIPVIIAYIRKHDERATIAKLSPLSLLSFALWFALIIWAATDKRDDSVVSRYIEKIRDNNLGPWIIGGLVLIGVGGAAASVAL